MLTIPPPRTTHQSIPADVDGVPMVFRFDYGHRSGDWRVTVSVDDVVIISGRRLAPGWNPFKRVKSEAMPPGVFYFRSPLDPPGADAFGRDDVALVYFTEAEAADLATAAPAQPAFTFTEA
jgi:hypothetical protein